MKVKISYILAVLTLVIYLASCKEEPPAINLSPTLVSFETTYVAMQVPQPELREVFIEYVSGVRCPNCPDASIIIKNLKNSYPNRINSVTIHPNTPSLSPFTRPINKDGFVSKYDFRSQAGGDILNKLGIPASLPSGFINRKIFPGKVNRFLERTEWTALTISELDTISNVNIALLASVEADNAIAEVTITFLNNLSGNYFLSVMLAEDSIVDVQEYQDGLSVKFDSLYAHAYVLRDLFTANTGDVITGSVIGGQIINNIERGRVIRKRFSKPMEPNWKRNNLYAIVLVHRGSDEVVVQSKRARLSW
jgi:hypothetical protein